MACRNAFETQKINNTIEDTSSPTSSPTVQKTVKRLLFGVDTYIESNDLLQNNINQFEWIVRNKIYPNFVGRNIVGDNALTKDEISFLHNKGCKIAAIYVDDGEKKTKDQGVLLAKKIDIIASELGIPEGTAIFLELSENETVTKDYLLGFAKRMLVEDYTPAFKTNTDAKFAFDREFSRCMQTDKDTFSKCLIWAVSPSLSEYDGITTSHLIHPDNWAPFAPSGIKRNEIAIWQYGKNCHPIEDDNGKDITFNLDLVRNEDVIIKKMF